MRVGTMVLAGMVSLPLGLVAVRAVAITASQFFDPCFQWGIGNSSSGTIRRDDPCRSRSGSSETKTQAVARMLIVPGGILAGLAGASEINANPKDDESVNIHQLLPDLMGNDPRLKEVGEIDRMTLKFVKPLSH